MKLIFALLFLLSLRMRVAVKPITMADRVR